MRETINYFIGFLMMFLLLMGCEEKAPWTPNLPDEPKDTTTVTPGTNPFKAPLY